MSFLSLPAKGLLHTLIIILIIALDDQRSCCACSSCMVSSVFGGLAGVGGGRLAGHVPPTSHYNSHHMSHARTIRHRHMPRVGKNGPKAVATAMIVMTIDRLSTHYGTSILFNHMSKYRMAYDSGSDNDSSDGNELKGSSQSQKNAAPDSTENSQERGNQTTDNKTAVVKPITAGMVGAIGFYKNFISPLLPPACRFLPTCSQYGVQAIEEFGPQKGLILTVWRLMRCSPLGGRGYDPPRWPPVSYTYGSY